MGIKIWGNHCGPMHGESDDGTKGPVDDACKKHDANYGKNGYFDLGSDLIMVRDQFAAQFSGNMTLGDRLASLGIAAGFLQLTPLSGAVTAARFLRPVGESALDLSLDLSNMATTTFNGIRDGVSSAGTDLASGIVDGADGLVEGAGDVIGGVFGGIGSIF